MRKDALVKMDIWEGTQVVLNGFETARVQVFFVPVYACIMFASRREARKGVEQMKRNLALALTDHACGTALEDTYLGDGTGKFTLCFGEGMNQKSLVACEQPLPLIPCLADQVECIGVFVKSESQILEAGRERDEQSLQTTTAQTLDQIGL